MRKFLPPLIPFVVIMLAVEFIVRGGFVPAYLVPAPSAVLRALIGSRDELAAAMAKTSAAALIGFALSTLTGIAIAVLLSSSRAIQRAFYPYAVFFQTVPIIAIAPLLVIWFGIGIASKAALAMLLVAVLMFFAVFSAVAGVDRRLIERVRTLGGGQWLVLRESISRRWHR